MIPDWPLNDDLMRAVTSSTIFLGFLGTTEYRRLVRLKLWVNLEREREREKEGGGGKDGEGGKEG